MTKKLLIHPGEILAGELAEIEVSPAELARQLHVPSNRLYQILAGRRAMTADTALRLEQWLGVEAAFWMNLQKSYELDLAAEQIGAEIKRTVARWHPQERPAPLRRNAMDLMTRRLFRLLASLVLTFPI